MYSQGSQCSVSAPKIGHLLIATLLGYDLKMKIIIAFDYSLGRKKSPLTGCAAYRMVFQ